ncbi:MAG: MFS transporter [Pseudomonadota bacterium]|nr:MFS transporter [Pseudomonadota bacterium]
MSSNIKWFALISLYLVQGLPHGFFGQAMPVLLREQGVDLKSIGLMSLVALPWALKFIWAPVLDRVTLVPGEFRRSWILAMNHTAVLVLVGLSFVPLTWLTSEGVLALALVLMAVNLLTATQDIATDAVAVENLKPTERGLGNGIQVGGYRVGMVLAGGVLLSFFNWLGWQFSLLSVAALMFLGSLPLYFWKPRRHTLAEQDVWRQWSGFFRLDSPWLWLALIALYKFGDAFGTQMIRPYLSDLGLSLEQMGTLLGIGGFIAGLTGAVLGGWLSGRMQRAHALVLFLVFETLAMLGYALIEQGNLVSVWMAVLAEHLAGGMATAALFTVMMDRCREHSEGADYAFQSCVVIITGMVAGALSGYSATHLGYASHFVLAAILCSLVVGIVIAAQRRDLFLNYKGNS